MIAQDWPYFDHFWNSSVFSIGKFGPSVELSPLVHVHLADLFNLREKLEVNPPNQIPIKRKET